MKSDSRKNSPFSVIWKCILTQRIFKILIPLGIAFIVLSSYTNIQAKNLFDNTNNFYVQNDTKLGFSSFQMAMFTVAPHYLLSQISSFLIGFLSLRIFKAFLVESLSHSINLEYSKFHSKGCAAFQDEITRSSKAARDVFVIIFFDITWAFFDTALSVLELYKMLNLKYFFKMMVIFSCGCIMACLVAIYSYNTERKNLKLYTNSLDPLSDTLNNFDIVKSFNAEDSEIRHYHSSLLPYQSASDNFFLKINALKFFQKTLLLLPNVLIYYYISQGYNVWKDERNTITCIVKYNNMFSSLKKCVVALRDQIFYYTKYTSQMNTDDSLFGKKATEPLDLIDKKTFDVEISLDNVDLYAGNNLIQRNASFKILKNQKVAITGSNGCGKSVFMKTLLKFFKNEGNFYIDGVLIQNISSKSIRKLISYAPQDPHIFNNTVMYNLAYSQKNLDEQKIFSMCEKFGLHEFFKSLRDGYYTMAGEKGKYLSGGQKQRISFMRSIIKDAPIILMDEPTANIDKKSEFDLFDKVLENCHDRTFLLIVHNPDLLSKFDKIIHFDKTGIACFDSYEAYKTQYK